MKLRAAVILSILSYALGYPQRQAQESVVQSALPTSDDSDMYLDPQESREPRGQAFYPSFPPFEAPPLGHSRPIFFQQEAAYSQRPQAGYQQQQLAYDSPRFAGYKDSGYHRTAANSEARGVLGSGNFGVIKGGTFYDKDSESSYTKDYSTFFRNGHGRPSLYANPRPYQHDQFANFRDFADINTPAYSQYVVVYVNKNGTKEQEVDAIKRPKNIIESLALLDLENSEIPPKKMSKSKAKLAKLLPEKKHKIKNSKIVRDLHEPMLALS